MQCLKVCLGILISIITIPAFADDTYQNKYGISYGGSTGLAIRKSISENWLLYAGIGLGYGHFDSSCCNGNDNSYAITFGTRRLLSIDKLSKFIDVELKAIYQESSNSVGFNSHGKGASIFVAYGIEYFLTSNVSIEGKAGISLDYFENSSNGTSSNSKSVNFPRAATAITYYW